MANPPRQPKLTPEKAQYLAGLMEEKGKLDPSLTHTNRLLSEEIDRVQTGRENDKYVEIHNGKPCKMKMRILIPIKEYPKVNFVGKMLGPKGATLKQLQEETGTKMSILGKGSVRDKKKEEELRKEGGRYCHLDDELHLNVDSFGLPSENYRRFSMVVEEVQRFLIPDEQDVMGGGQQFGDMMYLNGENQGGRGRGRGRGGVMGRGGRGAGAAALLGSSPVTQMPQASRGAVRGARGRGAPSAMGRAPPPSMGAGRLSARAALEQGFEEDPYYGGGGAGAYEEQAFAEQDYADPYDQGYSSGGLRDTQYFDYGHGSSAQEEDYGDQWGATQSAYGKTAGRMRAGGMGDRTHPYTATQRTARY